MSSAGLGSRVQLASGYGETELEGGEKNITEYRVTHGSYIRSHLFIPNVVPLAIPGNYGVTIVTGHTHCRTLTHHYSGPIVRTTFELIEISQNEMELNPTVVLIPRSPLHHE